MKILKDKIYKPDISQVGTVCITTTSIPAEEDINNSTRFGGKQDFKNFKSYTTKDKPPKCKEKVNIEASFFEIDVKLKELRQPHYVPSEGHRLSDIDQAWKALEKEEHLQETALRSELMRLERLEQLAAKFNQTKVR